MAVAVLAARPQLRAVPEAFTPSVEMVAPQRAALADAVAAGQLGPNADSDEALYLVSTLIAGVPLPALCPPPAPKP